MASATCGRPGVKLCPLPRGNDTASPYQLSIHGAWMLVYGIEEYALIQLGIWRKSACHTSYS
jgi:hypothetical protein